jgi:hypothetical protein
MKRICIRLFLLFGVTAGLFLTAGPAPLLAQTSTGRIIGTVRDQTGGAIIGATVTVTDTQRNTSRTLTTDRSGAFLAPNLTPSTYNVRVEYAGFRQFVRQNVSVGVAADTTLDIELEPGEQTQTITVTEQVPLIDTQTATLGGTLSNDVINELPIAGRNFQNLMELRPGVVQQLGNNSNGGGPNAVNGLRAESSINYSVDGVFGIDPYTGQSVINNIGVNGDAASILPPDAIQEYNQQFNPKAEYGFKAGSSVAVGLKSGTNVYHGTGYSFFRNDAMDARNHYNTKDQPKINMDLKQFGGTFGGPVVKDKLFFFMGYEQQLVDYGNASSQNIPFTDPSMLTCANIATGTLASCTPAGMAYKDHLILSCIGLRDNGTPLSPRSLALAGLNSNCTPTGSYPGNLFIAHGGNSTEYFPNAQTHVLSLGSLAKVDFHASDKHNLSGFLFWGEGDRKDGLVGGGPLIPDWRTHFLQHSRMAAATWTWLVSPSVVNSFRTGWSVLDQPSRGLDVSNSNQPCVSSPIVPGSGAACNGIPTGATNPYNFGLPAITFTDFHTAGSRQTEFQGPGHVLEIADDVSYLLGEHSLKFGGGIMYQSFSGGIWLDGKGTFTFGRGSDDGVAAFLAGQNIISTATQSILQLDPGDNGFPGISDATRLYGNPNAVSLRSTYSLFVQDDWRVMPRVTLNLGLRYDYSTPLHGADNLLGSWDPNFGMIQEGFSTNRLYKGDNRNFSPRVGFVWDINGNGKTVLRGGASLIYDLVTLRSFLEVGNDLGLGGVPTAFVIGCSGPIVPSDPNDPAASESINADGVSTNCLGSLTTSGGSRAVGAVDFNTDSGTLGAIDWEGNPIFPSRTGGFNCNLNITIDGVQGTPCQIGAVDRNLKSPYVETWNLSLQHSFGGNVVLDVAYVGNRGVHLLGKTDPNQPLDGSGWAGQGGQAGCDAAYATYLANPAVPKAFSTFQGKCGNRPNTEDINASRPYATKFPYLSTITQMGNYDWSNYDGLQTSVSMRNFHGVSGLIGYTWSHALEVSPNNNSGLPVDSYNRNLDYGAGSNDIRHRFTMGLNYDLPGSDMGHGLLRGWRLAGNFKAQTGNPITPTFNKDFAGTARGGNTTHFDAFGDPADFHPDRNNDPANLPKFFGDITKANAGVNNADCKAHAASEAMLAAWGCWVQGSYVLTPPQLGTYGNYGKGTLRGYSFWNIDFSVAKTHTITERFSAEFRAQIFNLLNHPLLGDPTGTRSGIRMQSSGGFYKTFRTADVLANNPYLGSGGARRMELGIKLIF